MDVARSLTIEAFNTDTDNVGVSLIFWFKIHSYSMRKVGKLYQNVYTKAL